MCNRAERDDGAQLLHFGHGGIEEIAAGRNFGSGRLVFRWYAAHRVGDSAVDQLQAVIRPRVEFTIRESETAECFVEQHAGVVAGEWPSGAVGALHTRREADDQQPCVDGAERGDRRVKPC